MENESVGKVIFAGAGCGDPELITVKAARYLQQADIVLSDRLVSEEILTRYTSYSTQIIFVGKEGNHRKESVSQTEIDDLLVEYASQGKLVVRLKGGDVSVFSNILDELKTLSANNIPYEIIPGITAASGAAAYAGIPLTARGYARGVRFLTYSEKYSFGEKYWGELASTEDTLVFYMAGNSWYDLAKKLLAQNISLDKKLAVIQQATTPFQKVKTYSFEALSVWKPNLKFVSPSLIIIGKVVELQPLFSWKENSQEEEFYFQSASRQALESSFTL